MRLLLQALLDVEPDILADVYVALLARIPLPIGARPLTGQRCGATLGVAWRRTM